MRNGSGIGAQSSGFVQTVREGQGERCFLDQFCKPRSCVGGIGTPHHQSSNASGLQISRQVAQGTIVTLRHVNGLTGLNRGSDVGQCCVDGSGQVLVGPDVAAGKHNGCTLVGHQIFSRTVQNFLCVGAQGTHANGSARDLVVEVRQSSTVLGRFNLHALIGIGTGHRQVGLKLVVAAHSGTGLAANRIVRSQLLRHTRTQEIFSNGDDDFGGCQIVKRKRPVAGKGFPNV